MTGSVKVIAGVKHLWEVWKNVAHKIGNFQARVLLTIFYGVLVSPMGLIVRLFGDPLRIKKVPEHWLDHSAATQDWDPARRQW